MAKVGGSIPPVSIFSVMENACYIYVLRSLKNRKRYIGSTRLTPETRLQQHHSGSNRWTKQNSPFELIYSEKFLTYSEARKRENFLKSGVGRKFLDQVLSKSVVSNWPKGLGI